MDESINNSSKESLLQSVQDQPSSSKFKKKLPLLALFTLIIFAIISLLALLKHKYESKLLSNNPLDAIQAVCWLPDLSEDPSSCVDSIASNYYTDDPPPFWSNRERINLSQLFMLSIHTSMNELRDLYYLPPESTVFYSDVKPATNPKTKSVLKECHGMFKFSLTQLNESMISFGDDPDEKVLGSKKFVWDLQSWIGEAMGQVERCIDWLEMTESTVADAMRRRTRMCQEHMMNSRGILRNVDEILEMFHPRIGSAFCSLVLEFLQYDLSVWFFCLQYLLLFFLFCLLLRS